MYFHDIILSDKSQSHKRQILHNSTYMNEFSKIVKFIESESGMVVSRDWREKDLGLLIYEQKFSFRQDELFSDIYTTLFLKWTILYYTLKNVLRIDLMLSVLATVKNKKSLNRRLFYLKAQNSSGINVIKFL